MHDPWSTPRSDGRVGWRTRSMVNDAENLIERNLGADYASAARCRRGAQASVADRLC